MANMTQDSDVIFHALTHRQEYTVEGLYDLEPKFSISRTTLEDGTRKPAELIFPRAREKNENGTPKPLKHISSKSSKEICRPNHFAHLYTRRIYDHSATEIMSMGMGMESISSGTNGGMAGVSSYLTDPNMRDFILGILAIVPGGKESQAISSS